MRTIPDSARSAQRTLRGFAGALGLGGSLLQPASASAGINPLPDYAWTFDAAFTGRLVQETSIDGVADYSYDPRGQLTGASYSAGPLAAEGPG